MLDVQINPSNAPRDIEELKKLKRSTLLRVALAANIWNGNNEAEHAFMAATQDEMASALLTGLQQWDANRGAPPTGAPATPATMAPPFPARCPRRQRRR